jgi:hypothetical protein
MLKKITPRKKKNVGKQLENVFILTLILLLVLDCYYFWIAFHNVDLSTNVLRITDSLNSANLYDANGSRVTLDFSKIFDKGSDFISRPVSDYYIISLNNLSVYFMLGLFDCLLLGIMLGRRL